MTKKTKNKVISLPLTPARLMAEIRKRAKDSDNVFFSEHAFDRIRERSGVVEITNEDVYRVLQLGELDGSPSRGKKDGEWKATVSFRPKGSRTMGVVTVIKGNDDKIFVLTVMWRDA